MLTMIDMECEHGNNERVRIYLLTLYQDKPGQLPAGHLTRLSSVTNGIYIVGRFTEHVV